MRYVLSVASHYLTGKLSTGHALYGEPAEFGKNRTLRGQFRLRAK